MSTLTSIPTHPLYIKSQLPYPAYLIHLSPLPIRDVPTHHPLGARSSDRIGGRYVISLLEAPERCDAVFIYLRVFVGGIGSILRR